MCVLSRGEGVTVPSCGSLTNIANFSRGKDCDFAGMGEVFDESAWFTANEFSCLGFTCINVFDELHLFAC